MTLAVLALIGGLIVLVWSADRFVHGASGLANNLGVSPLLIGMMIVGFGTSAPEIMVGATAALGGNSELAVGNAIGSNIANMALVLGSAALIAPLAVESKILRREFPVLLVVTIAVWLLIYDLELSRLDGAILLIGLAGMLTWMYRLSTRPGKDKDIIETEFDAEVPKDMNTGWAVFWSGAGLLLLVGSSYILVWGAIEIAAAFGVSELVIGLTIIAVGTSLPEVAVSVAAALKREHDIVLGNIIGSNMFNLLAVLGVSSSIQGSQLQPEVLSRDYAVMLLLTIAMFIIGYGFRGIGRVNRYEALFLLLSYVAYMYWIYQSEIL